MVYLLNIHSSIFLLFIVLICCSALFQVTQTQPAETKLIPKINTWICFQPKLPDSQNILIMLFSVAQVLILLSYHLLQKHYTHPHFCRLNVSGSWAKPAQQINRNRLGCSCFHFALEKRKSFIISDQYSRCKLEPISCVFDTLILQHPSVN